jgi:hypothetical protein
VSAFCGRRAILALTRRPCWLMSILVSREPVAHRLALRGPGVALLASQSPRRARAARTSKTWTTRWQSGCKKPTTTASRRTRRSSRRGWTSRTDPFLFWVRRPVFLDPRRKSAKGKASGRVHGGPDHGDQILGVWSPGSGIATLCLHPLYGAKTDHEALGTECHLRDSWIMPDVATTRQRPPSAWQHLRSRPPVAPQCEDTSAFLLLVGGEPRFPSFLRRRVFRQTREEGIRHHRGRLVVPRSERRPGAWDVLSGRTLASACSQRSSAAKKSSSTVLNAAGLSSMVMCAVFGRMRMRLLAIPAAICRCQLNGVTRS